jgi:NAD(P)-dependent dehydrogenase (short-subunit alcohol dehydrogenase family)
MRRTLQSKRFLITGANSSVGRALASLAATQGVRLALVDEEARSLEQLAGELAGRCEVVPIAANITSESDRSRILETAVDQLGGLDGLIHVGGIAPFGRFAQTREDSLRRVMEVNFFAPAELIRLAVPVLTQGQQPVLVNLASLAGRRGLPGWSEVAASEFALVGLTEALRGEMVRFGIDVLLLITARQPQPDPQQVAAALLNAIRHNRRETVLGWQARWLLLRNRWLPGWVDRLMIRQAKAIPASAPVHG